MEERRYSSWMLERIGIGDTVRLRLGASTIGRHSSSVIRILDSAYVSRHHAIIEVSENDQNVTLQDVSSNGIYVNDVRYEKVTIDLNNEDLIGIGVTANDYNDQAEIIKLPIYQLKYAPIRPLRIPNANRAASTAVVSNTATPAVVSNTTNSPAAPIPASSPSNMSVVSVPTKAADKDKSKKTDDNNRNQDDKKPCINMEKLTSNDEIFEISDDDDDNVERDVKERSKNYKMNAVTQTKENDKLQELSKDFVKQIELIIKNEVNEQNIDDKDYINPSQKNQNNKIKEISTNTENNSKEPSKANEIINIIDKTHAAKDQENSNRNSQEKDALLHVSIISNIKKENLRSVSADIENIFGDIDGDDELKKTIKEINPLVYNEIHVAKNFKPLDGNDQVKMLNNGEYIVLTDDEDLEVEELGIIIPANTETKTVECTKSPNIFDTSLDNSKGELLEKVKQDNENLKDNIDLEEFTKYTPNSDDEDIEDLMFSQVIINDMKAELQDDENLSLNKINIDNLLPSKTNINNELIIKQELGAEVVPTIPKELENSCWIISDDEDYDEELETKVNDWSNKIFSQSFNLLSQNMSQVYDLNESDNIDTNEDDDDDINNNEDDFNLLEDDIEGIASIYNKHDNNENIIDNNYKDSFTKEIKDNVNLNEHNQEKKMEDGKPKESESDEIDHKKEFSRQLPCKDTSSKDVKDVSETNVEDKNKLSPLKSTDNSCNLTESPLVRVRRLSKTNPVIESPSSSEDEFELDKNKLNNDIKASETRLPPPVIEAPSLPKHRGKLRGVSAELPNKTASDIKAHSVNKKLSSIKDKIFQENYTKDLKRKWLEKPSIAKKHDKERKKFIKECRKDKLKELAERKKSPSKENIKRKVTTDDHEHKAKVAKVKVTTHNRGAFLVETPSIPQPQKPIPINQFKIPKVSKKSEDNKKEPLRRSLSIDGLETFSQQISKPDVLLMKKCDKPAANGKMPATPLRRHSTTESPKRSIAQTNATNKPNPTPTSNPVCKEAIAARAVRTTNKITFASMEKNIIESEENKRKLCALTTQINNVTANSIKSNLSFTTKPSNVKKKTVRFNDTPVIHYIERVVGACKKINNKDVLPMTTYRDRRHMIRTAYPIIDHTDSIISKILCWSNEWLIKRNADAEAAGDIVYPMPTYFNSFEHYKSIIFPLMKLEFLSFLEREYNTTQHLKKFKVSLEYATHNKDRLMLVTKFANNQSKELTDNSLYDLVILETDKRAPPIFAYMVANRKGAGSYITLVYEIMANNFTIEFFKTIKELQVRPTIDKVRVHFGSFNAVYQLQSTPLFQKIMNPLELLKSRPPPKKKVIYRGFDPLNDKQKQVLLNTYTKIIDESTANITLIQGPPGTGKSCVITNLVLQTLYGEEVRYLDKKILICAQSNAAVDVIAGKLYDISLRMRPEKRFRIIRFGILNKIHPSVLPITLQKLVEHDQLKKLQAKNKNIQLENKENLKNQILQFESQILEMSSRNIRGTVEEDLLIEKKRQLQLMRNILNENMRPEDERSLFTWYLSNANIVCATLSSCSNLMQYINFFDICIIDEATQCTEPWTLLPLKFGINSLVLVGDTQQLPATVLSKKANDLGLGISMFTRIQQCLDNIPSSSAKGTNVAMTTPNNIIYSLQTQYRMHPEICRWPNQYFYRNELINGKSVLEFTKSPLVPFSILNLSYTQHNACSNGKISNDLEAEFVVKLLKALDGFIPNKYNSYGVITPYAEHRTNLESSIRSLGLTNIMVNTIDSYQGTEKDIIVISNARTRGIGFLSNPQRLNVALTRAKKCLILCGNFKSLENVPAWRCLLQNARERKLYYEISANCITDIHKNVMDKLKLKNQNL
ncbi:putative helicase senataxin [Cochliomyia hominivorax]